MATVHKYIPNYTVSDYQQWKGDWELLNGIPIAMGPSPFGRHQSFEAAFVATVWPQLKKCNPKFQVLAEIDWIIDEHTVVRPDVLIVSGGIPEKHVNSRPELIVEILSKATEKHDREIKKQLYQLCEVPFYLLADCESKSLEVYRLAEAKYQLLPTQDHVTIDLSKEMQIQLDVGTLFE